MGPTDLMELTKPVDLMDSEPMELLQLVSTPGRDLNPEAEP